MTSENNDNKKNYSSTNQENENDDEKEEEEEMPSVEERAKARREEKGWINSISKLRLQIWWNNVLMLQLIDIQRRLSKTKKNQL